MKLRDESFAIKMAVMVGGQFPCGPERISAYKTALHLAERKAQKVAADVRTLLVLDCCQSRDLKLDNREMPNLRQEKFQQHTLLFA